MVSDDRKGTSGRHRPALHNDGRSRVDDAVDIVPPGRHVLFTEGSEPLGVHLILALGLSNEPGPPQCRSLTFARTEQCVSFGSAEFEKSNRYKTNWRMVPNMAEHTDVVVIGGGIAGCSTAYYLAAEGVEVTLLEQHEPGACASGVNAGSLHAQIPPEPFLVNGADWARSFAPALPLFLESIRLWEAAGESLAPELAVSLDGGLVVAATDFEMRMLEQKFAIDHRAGLEMELLGAEDLRRRFPWLSGRLIGGAFCPVEGKADPLVAVPTFAVAARRLGATIKLGCRVDAIRRSGSFYEIETTRGGHRATRIVNAAGVRAGSVAELVGAGFDDLPFVQQLIVTEKTTPLIDCLTYAVSERLTLKQTRDGTIVIGGGWPARRDAHGHACVLASSFVKNLRIATDVVPVLRTLGVVRSWAAPVNGSESWRPLIGEMPGLPGFFVNWVPWMGFSGALAASRIVASLVRGQAPPVDFDVSYFSP